MIRRPLICYVLRRLREHTHWVFKVIFDRIQQVRSHCAVNYTVINGERYGHHSCDGEFPHRDGRFLWLPLNGFPLPRERYLLQDKWC